VGADVNTAAVTLQYLLPLAVEFTDLSLWEGIAFNAASAAALLACTSECMLLLTAMQLWCLWLVHIRQSSEFISCHLNVCLFPCS